MDNFYFFTIISVIIFSFSKKGGFIFSFIGCCFFLMYLPSTNYDYEIYKITFENSYFVNEFPWFKSNTSITSEPFYLWYNSFIGVLLPFGFPFFLAFNYFICVLISFIGFRLIKKEYLYFFWLFFLPVIFPTIFYFSPRSSISFFLVFLGLTFLVKNNHKLSLLFFFLGIITHSQFIIIVIMLIATSFYFKIRVKKNTNKFFKKIIFLSVTLFVVLKFATFLSSYASNLLSFLPSAEIIESKMGYLERTRSNFRLTGILSIFVYPYFAYKILIMKRVGGKLIFFKKNTEYDLLFIYLIVAVTFYGASINLAFIESAHIAGRLSRFSDYIGMGIVFPAFFNLYIKNKMVYVVLLILCILSPLLYSTIYVNVNWGFW